MKEKVTINDQIANTLFIPLYMRFKESRRPNVIMIDHLACELINRIDYDFSQFDKAPLSELGCVVRGCYFDRKVQEFILREPSPIVVNIGCGLDTRFQRITERRNATFYELDLPEVIDLREEFLPIEPADINLRGSMLDTDWMDRLKSKHPQSRFIFIIEGVVMYFTNEQVKSVLSHLAKRFPGGEIHLDVCGSMFQKKGIKPDALKNNNEARMLSAIDNGRVIEQWIPQLEMTDNILYQNIEKKRWGAFGVFCRMFPGLSRKFSHLLGYKIIE